MQGVSAVMSQEQVEKIYVPEGGTANVHDYTNEVANIIFRSERGNSVYTPFVNGNTLMGIMGEPIEFLNSDVIIIERINAVFFRFLGVFQGAVTTIYVDTSDSENISDDISCLDGYLDAETIATIDPKIFSDEITFFHGYQFLPRRLDVEEVKSKVLNLPSEFKILTVVYNSYGVGVYRLTPDHTSEFYWASPDDVQIRLIPSKGGPTFRRTLDIPSDYFFNAVDESCSLSKDSNDTYELCNRAATVLEL